MSPFIDQADANASPTAILDALIGVEEAGTALESNGISLWHILPPGCRELPLAVEDALYQCGRRLAEMLRGRVSPARRR